MILVWVIQMCIKRIVAFTGTRADYDLLSGLYKKINKEKDLELKLVVSGSHLSSSYGNSVNEILKDEIPILTRIENLLDSDKPSARVKSLSLLLQNSIHTIQDYNPDLIVVVGDREEVIVGTLIGSYLSIPTAHFFGGDHASDGNVDNPIRHATSKLANIHFVTNEMSRKRLLRMGEEKNRIFNVGSPSLDRFKTVEKLDKPTLLKKMNLNGIERYALLIFHPILGDEINSGHYFQQILTTLEEKKIFTFVSYPNVDSGNKQIVDIIQSNKDNPNFFFYKNLDRDTFVNLFRNTDFLIGNSSAGIYEAPFLKIPVINVGKRQTGRYATNTTLFTDNKIEEISNAIDKVQEKEFIRNVESINSIYGDGESEEKILEILRSIELQSYLYKENDPLEMNNE